MGDIATATVTELLGAVFKKIWAKPVPRAILSMYGAAGLGCFAYSMLRPEKDLKGKTVLITGGAAGLGKAMAKEFVARGAKRLILWDINAQALQQAQGELKHQVEVLTQVVDLSKKEQIYESADKLLGDVGLLTSSSTTPVLWAASPCLTRRTTE